jgi:hypothetical protein
MKDPDDMRVRRHEYRESIHAFASMMNQKNSPVVDSIYESKNLRRRRRNETMTVKMIRPFDHPSLLHKLN